MRIAPAHYFQILNFDRLFVHSRSCNGIAKEVGVAYSTVVTACENFVRLGRVSRGNKGKARREIPDEIMNWITSAEALNELKFLSMK